MHGIHSELHSRQLHRIELGKGYRWSVARFNRNTRPAVALELVVERDAVDVENLGSAALVASTFFENMQDVSPLDFVQTFAGGGSSWLRFENEILLAQFRLLRDNQGALDGVFQFAHVAHPRLLLQ